MSASQAPEHAADDRPAHLRADLRGNRARHLLDDDLAGGHAPARAISSEHAAQHVAPPAAVP